jgi:predicted nucleic acid-binding protein
MRIVLDTGILIAALITADTPPDKIYQAWKKKLFELFTAS